MSGLSKSRLLAHRQCPKRLWLQVHKPTLAPAFDAATQARLDSGNQVGVIARALHPGGLLIETDDLRQALQDTAEALSAQPTRPLFEATFEHEGVLVRLDLLLPAADGYRLVEVKSSTSVKDYHLPDAAVQAWVARHAGLTIQEVAIGHIDNGFFYPGNGDYRGLLKEVPVDAEIDPLLADIPGWVADARSTLGGGEPDIAPGPQCATPFACPFLEYCAPPTMATEPGYSVDDLPRGKSLAEQLRAEGYADLRDVPVGRLTHPLHQRVQACAQKGSAYLDPQARAILENLPYPRFFIDFETYGPAIPIWPGTRPYIQVPFQWSCHVESAEGGLSHQAYLAEGPADPRRPFTETLLSAVGESGPVLVYNAAFERTRLRELAVLFPDLAARIDDVVQRMVDLLPIARQHYYHPDQHGSWSIKAVLPTLAPDLAYEGMVIADGQMAQAAFQEILDPATTEDRSQDLRKALLDYCGLDTLAMVKVARFFAGTEDDPT